MSDKKILYLLVAGLMMQILFSFYYSGEIINQNNLLSNNQLKHNQLKKEIQSLEKNFTSLTSIQNIQAKTASQSYIVIEKKLELNKN